MDTAQEKEEKSVQEDSNEVEAVEKTEKGEEKALYDQPLVLEGKRKRKSTELFSFDKDKSRKTQEYTGGEGTRLGDIPFIEHSITKLKSERLRALFRLCYDRTGARTEIKRSLRDFSGFSDEDLIEKKRASLDKMFVSGLKPLCEILGLEVGGKKEDIVTRIIEFLKKPVDLGKEPKKRRSSSIGEGRKRKKSKVSESDEEKGDNDDVMEEQDDSVMETSQTADGKEDAVDSNEQEEKKEEEKDDKEPEDKQETEQSKQETEQSTTVPTAAASEADSSKKNETETKTQEDVPQQPAASTVSDDGNKEE